LEEPQDPCSPEKSPELRIQYTNSAYESYNHLMLLNRNNFKRMVEIKKNKGLMSKIMGYINSNTLTSFGDGTPSKEDRNLARLVFLH
ncbi:hypothetical protein BAE44_0022804, partial [Dichanthelium oligosanthes]